MKYASKTTVSPEKSRAEIEKTLTRYGATGFMYGWAGDSAIVGFELKNKRIKFVLPLPLITDREITHDIKGRSRPKNSIPQAHEQSIRQRWRALALQIKSKLESVESGISEFESEFMAHIVLPDGKTVAEHMIPQINHAYETGNMPPLLPKM